MQVLSSGFLLYFNMALIKKDGTFFKVGEEIRSDVHAIDMSRARDKEKNLSPWQELNLWPSVHRSDALTTELQRTRSALGHTQGVSITYANYALISYVRVNVWIAMCDLSIFVPHFWLNYILHDLDYCNLEVVKIHSSSLVAFNLNLLLTGELSIQLFLV